MPFFLVSALASLPSILIVPASPEVPADSLQALGWKLSGAFNATFGVVAYRELRVAKEGIDTAQIGAVFERGRAGVAGRADNEA